MAITTTSQFDMAQLRKLLAQALKLPDEQVRASALPQAEENGAFVTVDVLFSKEIGISRRTFDGATETVTTSCLTTVNLSAYGNNAFALALKVRSILQSSLLVDAFRSRGWGLVQMSDVRNLTATVGADYEERGQLDLVISHEHIIQMPLAPIERVPIRINDRSVDL